MRTFSISFVQHCEGMTPALHGTFAFRAGDSTPLIIGLLSVQIIVVTLFGVKPKKHRLEELDSESPLSPLPSQV